MIDLSPRQKKTVAAGVTVLAFTLILAFVLFIGWTGVKFFSYASPALMPVVLGIFLSMLFKPYYEFCYRHARNSSLALLLMLASVGIPLGAAVWFGGAFVVGQTIHFIKAAPTIIERLSVWVNTTFPTAKDLAVQFGAKPDDLLMQFLTVPSRFSSELISELGSAYGASAVRAGMGVLKYLTSVGTILLVLIFFVYFLMRPGMRGPDYVKELPFLKDETKGFVSAQIDSFLDILVSFFQRQVVICLIEGLLYGTGFMLVGLPYGFVLGFLLGTINLVPLLGTVLCLPLALPVAYFGDGGSLLRLIGVLIVWGMGQVLDGYLITPKIQGDKTGLGYAGVIFSFVFWGVVFHSILGLLLAIPLSAFCVVLWRTLKTRYITGVI